MSVTPTPLTPAQELAQVEADLQAAQTRKNALVAAVASGNAQTIVSDVKDDVSWIESVERQVVPWVLRFGSAAWVGLIGSSTVASGDSSATKAASIGGGLAVMAVNEVVTYLKNSKFGSSFTSK